MGISNSSFEIGTGIVGEAQDWTSSASTSCTLVGFGDEEKPFEEFDWGEYTEIISGSTAIFDSLTYEAFIWGSGSFIDEWYSGWTISTEDEFNWGFDDTWSAGTVAIVDDFAWDSFDDTWSAGTVAMFDDDTVGSLVPYESFEDSDWF
jgi:hypothetical protein